MDFFRFLLNFIVISSVFYYIWLPIALVLSLIATFFSQVLKFNNAILMTIVRGIGYYLWTGLLCGYTLSYLTQTEPNPFLALTYVILGLIMLYFVLFSGLYQDMKRMNEEFRYDFIQHIETEVILNNSFILVIASFILFIIGLFIPILVLNPITILLGNIIEWIVAIPIVGTIIYFLAILVFLNFSFLGIIGFSAFVVSIKKVFFRKWK